MKFERTALPGVILIEPDVYRDERGHFLESFHAEKYAAGGVPPGRPGVMTFVQDNESFSVHGTLRGLHGQRAEPQGKLMRVVQGEVFDVAVDIQPGSATFGQWVGCALSSDNFRQLYIPPGFLHGFCVVSETARVLYKCTAPYRPADEIGVIWNDPDIGVEWPVKEPILSAKDKSLPSLKEL